MHKNVNKWKINPFISRVNSRFLKTLEYGRLKTGLIILGKWLFLGDYYFRIGLNLGTLNNFYTNAEKTHIIKRLPYKFGKVSFLSTLFFHK